MLLPTPACFMFLVKNPVKNSDLAISHIASKVDRALFILTL